MRHFNADISKYRYCSFELKQISQLRKGMKFFPTFSNTGLAVVYLEAFLCLVSD